MGDCYINIHHAVASSQRMSYQEPDASKKQEQFDVHASYIRYCTRRIVPRCPLTSPASSRGVAWALYIMIADKLMARVTVS